MKPTKWMTFGHLKIIIKSLKIKIKSTDIDIKKYRKISTKNLKINGVCVFVSFHS